MPFRKSSTSRSCDERNRRPISEQFQIRKRAEQGLSDTSWGCWIIDEWKFRSPQDIIRQRRLDDLRKEKSTRDRRTEWIISEFKQSKKPSMKMKEIQDITGYQSRCKCLTLAKKLGTTHPDFKLHKGTKRTSATLLVYLPNTPTYLKKGAWALFSFLFLTWPYGSSTLRHRSRSLVITRKIGYFLINLTQRVKLFQCRLYFQWKYTF